MTTHENKLRKLLNENKPTVGTRIWTNQTFFIEGLGSTGYFDYAEFVAEYASYTLEELKLIKEKLLNEKIELEINVKDNKKINIDKNYLNKTCKECIFYKPDYGCENDSSKVRNKHLKTSNSKACYWGEWKNSGTKT